MLQLPEHQRLSSLNRLSQQQQQRPLLPTLLQLRHLLTAPLLQPPATPLLLLCLPPRPPLSLLPLLLEQSRLDLPSWLLCHRQRTSPLSPPLLLLRLPLFTQMPYPPRLPM